MCHDMENTNILKAFVKPAIRTKIQHFLHQVVNCSGRQRLEITPNVIL